MASNISCFADSLKNHRFVPGREQAEAQRPTTSRKEHLVAVLDEPCGDVGRRTRRDASVYGAYGLGPGFGALPPPVCDNGWEDAPSNLLTWHWAHRFWHPGPDQGRSAHPRCTRSRKGPERDDKSSSVTL